MPPDGIPGPFTLGEGTRFAGMFRAHGLLVPVWDLPREPPAREAIDALHARDIQVVMITGDAQNVAEHVRSVPALADRLCARLGRPVPLMAESDRNDPATVVLETSPRLGEAYRARMAERLSSSPNRSPRRRSPEPV